MAYGNVLPPRGDGDFAAAAVATVGLGLVDYLDGGGADAGYCSGGACYWDVGVPVDE